MQPFQSYLVVCKFMEWKNVLKTWRLYGAFIYNRSASIVNNRQKMGKPVFVSREKKKINLQECWPSLTSPLQWRGDESRSHLQASRSADRLHVPQPREVSRKMSTNSEYAIITYAWVKRRRHFKTQDFYYLPHVNLQDTGREMTLWQTSDRTAYQYFSSDKLYIIINY